MFNKNVELFGQTFKPILKFLTWLTGIRSLLSATGLRRELEDSQNVRQRAFQVRVIRTNLTKDVLGYSLKKPGESELFAMVKFSLSQYLSNSINTDIVCL